MTTLHLLADLRRAGMILTAKGDRLAFNAPPGVMTAEMRALLKSRKRELMAVLSEDWTAAAKALIDRLADDETRADRQFEFDERAGIIEYDGNRPRIEAERRAYLELAKAFDV